MTQDRGQSIHRLEICLLLLLVVGMALVGGCGSGASKWRGQCGEPFDSKQFKKKGSLTRAHYRAVTEAQELP